MVFMHGENLIVLRQIIIRPFTRVRFSDEDGLDNNFFLLHWMS